MVTVSTLGSHCAMQLLKGAKDEGLNTLLVCEKRRMSLYRRFSFIDKIVPVDSFADILNEPCASEIQNTILIPHGTLISQLGSEDIEGIKVPMFGNKYILKWESDRDLKEQMMREADLPVPDTVNSPDDIDDMVIVKRQGAAGGKGYFMASNTQEYHTRRQSLIADGVLSASEPLYIQRYISGVLAYLQFFYSPIRDEVEFFGCDQRHESDIEGISRIPASNQVISNTPSFNVIGNSPLVLRESLLDEAYKMAERFVDAARRLASPGMNGPFCIEGVYDADARFSAFEFSARIVAGTNIYMNGSPYYDLLFNESISMGRRIGREINSAAEAGRLDIITT
ncbi:MAG: formate--phosphoribosylaminoimidazolecarboxamide ligase [Cenarchaeum sp. SB0665_bin_23]|nr:formate--phosphoribosylaminoimidazolecarboxamide ligase [Cenarchaeum sp. SB0667_bin_13]MXY37517.1 formate--phosphoribosylaminoimidazolecarboxamide ligase [Cenarchaeum sp. SB0664_bin_35]MXY61730.1 formate--phosphoribosylaminoimidazolecarboxamide ligase [Cenarchaeum sp. SB0665_bin_23]MXZ93525.1 formate--phosphoribosylaminoimidazolecarboxamide ligase [Cenarchaeum sp. SB0666_bin_15]MYB46697.1 formate--phosphoribosylaminoimidazolecarboxamide ligase [Cenarchaeum sp. SB0662_bin_33]MYC78920.1 forma